MIILWCDWRDDVDWFLLECLRGRDRAEQLRIQDRGCLLVTGIDSGAARSVFPAGEILGYTEKDSETGRVCTSATGERVFDQGKQQILGTVDGKVRGLNMRVAQVKKSLTSVRDTCAAGHRVVCSTSTATRGS